MRNSARRDSKRVKISIASKSKNNPLTNKAVSVGWIFRFAENISWFNFISFFISAFTFVLIRDLAYEIQTVTIIKYFVPLIFQNKNVV